MRTTLIAVFGLTVSVYSATAGQVVTLTEEQQARAGVAVSPVVEWTFDAQTRVVGRVVRSPGSTVTVATILPGRVEDLAVAPGDLVVGGKQVVELHSHELLSVQGDLLRAAGASQLAATRHEAGMELFQLEGISRLDLQAREQEAFAASLELEAARSEMQDLGFSEDDVNRLLTSRKTDPHLSVKAPLDGVVLELMVQQHQWVQAFEPLLVVGDPEQVELELQIPPDQAAAVGKGDRVEFAPVGRPNLAGRGTVISRVPQVDPATRTMRIRARIDEDSQVTVVPGVFIEGVVVHGDSQTAPSVPQSSVIRLSTDDVVFVRTGPGSFEVRPVDIGLFDGTRYQIRSGVSVGDEVVVQGVFLIKSVLVTGESEDE